METITSLREKILAESARCEEKIRQLNEKIRAIKSLRNSIHVKTYQNQNIPGNPFSWDKVHRVPRPTKESVAGLSVEEAAQSFYLNLPSELVSEFENLVDGDHFAIPRCIDGALMVVGNDALGRSLTGSEKRRIRSAFVLASASDKAGFVVVD
jgi:small ligand-binding sensory domain FIST